MSETELSRDIAKALAGIGVWCVRIGSIGRRSARGARSGEPGIPDLWTPYGWLEVKLPDGILSDEQKAWHKKAHACGVNVETVRSVHQAVDCLLEWRQERLSGWAPRGYR